MIQDAAGAAIAAPTGVATPAHALVDSATATAAARLLQVAVGRRLNVGEAARLLGLMAEIKARVYASLAAPAVVEFLERPMTVSECARRSGYTRRHIEDLIDAKALLALRSPGTGARGCIRIHPTDARRAGLIK